MLEANPGFMETLKKQVTMKQTNKDAQGNVISINKTKVVVGGVTAERLTKQLEKLMAVSDVYRVRKLIITNPYYRTHYNEELSMNVPENASPEQKYLAKLLRTSFYLGKNLQRLGSSDVDINDASKRLNAEGKYTENAESKICRISGDDEDFDNTAEIQKAAKELRGSAYDKKVKEIKEKLRKERRANTDELLTELEHEKFTMPEEDMKFDLKTVGKKKVDKGNFIISNPSTTYELYSARKNKTSRDDINDKNSLKYRVKQIVEMEGVKGESIGVNSNRLGDHTGGDSLIRQLDNFTGQFVEDMTDEEVLEMVEGFTFSLRKEEKDRTPEEQKMAEDMYLQSYITYTNKVHQAMKKIMNTLGDNITTLHTEDWARLMSNPRFANLIVTQGAISANMEQHLPYEFLKKYSGQNVEHLKDFYMLSKAASAITFFSDGLRIAIVNKYKEGRKDDFEPIEEEAKEKLEEISRQIEENIKKGMSEDSKEMKELRQQEAEYTGQQAFPHLILMEREFKNLEEYRKKQFTDEDDEEIRGNIYELNKENLSETLGLGGYREVEMLKNSSYWEYGLTSEKEKREYKDSLKSKGIPECYDMEIMKKQVLRKADDVIKNLASMEENAKKYGLDTDLVEENMAALTKTLQSMKFSGDDLKAFLSKRYKITADNIESYRKNLTGDKKKDKTNIANIENGEEQLRLLEDLGNRLKIKFKEDAA